MADLQIEGQIERFSKYGVMVNGDWYNWDNDNVQKYASKFEKGDNVMLSFEIVPKKDGGDRYVLKKITPPVQENSNNGTSSTKGTQYSNRDYELEFMQRYYTSMAIQMLEKERLEDIQKKPEVVAKDIDILFRHSWNKFVNTRDELKKHKQVEAEMQKEDPDIDF